MKKIPHSYRKLPIKNRLYIPVSYFKIPISDIKKIRKISDGKKRLIEAAKLQYELFKDIHTDLTAWIAGYGSDSIIRQKFGSTNNIRDMFIHPLLKNSEFKPSWGDYRRNITLPEEMDEYLAEECGIHIGDGNLYISKEEWGLSNKYSIHGNLLNEYEYHTKHISDLMKRIYNCVGYFSFRENKNAIESVYKSKIILEYKRDILKFPIGNKKDIQIPKKIFGTREFERRCLCGIFDTDFNLSSLMILNGKMVSFKLLKQICELLKKNNIEYNYVNYKTYGYIKLSKMGSLKVIEKWGLKNKKHTSKYLIWKETKKYFPYTTTTERMAFLDGKLSLDNLEDISNKRKNNA